MTATSLLPFYQDELRSLRKDARIFAQRHPDLAKQLALNWGDNPDPTAERLIECMAWFAGRIRQDSEARLPLAAQQILAHICPAFTCPIPTIAIATLIPPGEMPNTHPNGATIPAGSRFVSPSPEDHNIRWQTAWDITLSAAHIDNITTGLPLPKNAPGNALSCLHLKVHNLGTQNKLSLFLKGDPYTTHPFHEFVMTNLVGVHALPSGVENPSIDLGCTALRQGGMSRRQTLLPAKLHMHPAFQLLHEYFLCPDRFLYWDLSFPSGIFPDDDATFVLTFKQKIPSILDERMLELETNAVPVVNLFETVSTPVTIDHTRHSFTLRADASAGSIAEIHSILGMEAIKPGKTRQALPRYFSGSQTVTAPLPEPALFWYSRRKPSLDDTRLETEVFIKAEDGSIPDGDSIIVARVLCTNGELAAMPGAGNVCLNKEDANLADRAIIERPPVAGYDPLRQGDELWRLVSLFSPGQRTFSDSGTPALETLKNILSLYAPPSRTGAFAQINAIRKLERRSVSYPVRPSRIRPTGGLASGHEYSLHLSREGFVQTSPYLFAAVLDRYFSLQADLKSFTRLKVYDGGSAPLHVWPARNGRDEI